MSTESERAQAAPPDPFASARALALVCALAASVSAVPAQADTRTIWSDSRPEDLRIKLVTFGPGDDVHNYFGHNGLIVEDRAQRRALLYNFGMFSFGPDMLGRYMQGKLTFWVGIMPVERTFEHYRSMNRSVHVQELDLEPERRMFFAQTVATRALPENREYLYDHYRNNCSTALRDIVDQATFGQFRRALARPSRLSYRGHTSRYAQRNPVVDFALIFWMNDDMEQKLQVWDELFSRASSRNRSGSCATPTARAGPSRWWGPHMRCSRPTATARPNGRRRTGATRCSWAARPAG